MFLKEYSLLLIAVSISLIYIDTNYTISPTRYESYVDIAFTKPFEDFRFCWFYSLIFFPTDYWFFVWLSLTFFFNHISINRYNSEIMFTGVVKSFFEHAQIIEAFFWEYFWQLVWYIIHGDFG